MNIPVSKAIFLDRDGVINEEIGNYVTSPDFFNVLPHVKPSLQKLQAQGFQLIIITNQGGIAKGLYSHATLQQIHQKLKEELLKDKISLLDIFYCPHHPDFGQCLCRKPGSLLIEKALAKYNLDRHHCFMIGDAERDMEAAASAGVKGYKIESNQGWSFIADEIAKNIGQ